MDKNLNNKTTDLTTLKSLLEIIDKSKENLEWVLQRQNQLRVEYLTFFKKDLKEIQASLGEIVPDMKSPDLLLEHVIKPYRDDILKSFHIVDVRHHRMIFVEQTIDRTAQLLKDEVEKYQQERDAKTAKTRELLTTLRNNDTMKSLLEGNNVNSAIQKLLNDINSSLNA